MLPVLLLVACGTSSSVNMVTGEISSRPAIELSNSTVIFDPLAPNWSIKEQALKPDTFHLALRASSYRIGGDGEAIQIVKRRALQLQRENGYAGFRILDYTEGIESSKPLTHRFSEGTIQLVNTPTPRN
jgi:hypothetical protein